MKSLAISLKQKTQKIEKIKSMLDRQGAARMCICEFCFNEGICPATFYNRQKIYKNTLKVGNLVPVSVQGSQEEINISDSANSSESICGTAVLEIKYPNGIELRFSGVLRVECIKKLLCR